MSWKCVFFGTPCSWTWTALERSCQPVVPPGETPSEDVDEQGRDQEGQEKNLQVHYLISVWLVTHSPADLFCPWPMAEVGSRQRGQRSSKPRSSRWPDVRAPAHCNLEDVTAIFQPLSSIWKETMKKTLLSGTIHLFIDITFFCHTSVSVFNFPKLFNSVSIFSSSWIESSVCGVFVIQSATSKVLFFLLNLERIQPILKPPVVLPWSWKTITFSLAHVRWLRRFWKWFIW